MYPCYICKQVFRYIYQLEAHKGLMHRAPEFACGSCHERFKSKTELTIHAREHSSSLRNKCEFCGRHFLSESALMKHMRAREKGFSCNWCSVCEREFKSYKALMIHMSQHNQSFPCDKCQLVFFQEAALHAHQCFPVQDTFKLGEGGIFLCDVCRKPFWQQQSLSVHKIIYHGRARNHDYFEGPKEERNIETQRYIESAKELQKLREKRNKENVASLDQHQNMYDCYFCPFSFYEETLRNEHEERHFHAQ